MPDHFTPLSPSGPVHLARPPSIGNFPAMNAQIDTKPLSGLSSLHAPGINHDVGLLHHLCDFHNTPSPDTDTQFRVGDLCPGRKRFDVPDRFSSASAPPDLEISSQSLFAFKAGYSGIFSDGRMDAHYESFYNNNPNRGKLPSPISASSSCSTGLPPLHPSQPSIFAGASSTSMLPVSTIAPSNPGIASSGNTTSEMHSHGLSHPYFSPSVLRRDNSSASFENLIYREASSLRPATGSSPVHTSASALVHSASQPLLNRFVGLSLADRDISPSQSQALSPEPPQGALPHSTHLYEAAPARHPYHHGQMLSPHPAATVAATPIGRPIFEGDRFHTCSADLSPVKHYEATELSSAFPTDPAADPKLYQPVLEKSMFSHALAGPKLSLSCNRSTAAVGKSVPSVSAHDTRIKYSSANANDCSCSLSPASTGSIIPGRYPEFVAPYSSSSARSSYSLTPEYLGAQAAAAAAAAAAAVYQSNGININPQAALAGFPVVSSYLPSASAIPKQPQHRPFFYVDPRRSGSASSGAATAHFRPHGMRSGSSRPSFDRPIVDRNTITSSNILSLDGVYSVGGGSSLNGVSAPDALKLSSFSDVVGRAEELARDQHGCRFLQTKLEEENEVYFNCIFEECFDKFVDLLIDPFGNYLCQKLFELCNDRLKLALVNRCSQAMAYVSTNMHGTRAIQRMVECLSTEDQIRAVCIALQPAAVELMKDINGNHVIQRCLQCLEPAYNQFVYDSVVNNCFELATHRHGCCVMQRCMDYASPSQRNQLAQHINAGALPLVQNPFGNYVVQYVLELNDPAYTADIISRLRGHLAELSIQKFSSNVVEKSLQLATRDSRRLLIDELISNDATMRRLLHDAYGNYVIQRVLQVAEGSQLDRICEAIRPHLSSLKQSPYGKRIQAKIMKRMPRIVSTVPAM